MPEVSPPMESTGKEEASGSVTSELVATGPRNSRGRSFCPTDRRSMFHSKSKKACWMQK